MTSSQAELGSDLELADLVAKIRRFDFAGATMNENSALVQALKVVTEDIAARWDAVSKLQSQLEERLAAASVAAELAGVVNAMRPTPAPKRRWANLWR